jgi:hypothetical protein
MWYFRYMTCDNCHRKATHIFSDDTGERCENCSGLSIISRVKTDGILTRNSWRIRRQQSRYEGDIVMPHIYDKTARRQRVNPDFVRLYPDKVKDYFNEQELTRDGYHKMPAAIARNNDRREKQKAIAKMETFYEGDSKRAIEDFLGPHPLSPTT